MIEHLCGHRDCADPAVLTCAACHDLFCERHVVYQTGADGEPAFLCFACARAGEERPGEGG